MFNIVSFILIFSVLINIWNVIPDLNEGHHDGWYPQQLIQYADAGDGFRAGVNFIQIQ